MYNYHKKIKKNNKNMFIIPYNIITVNMYFD